MTTRAKSTKTNASKRVVKTAKVDALKIEIEHLDIQKIQSDPLQPRKTFDEKLLNELAESIKAHGVLQPITVRSSVDGYIIVMGERRFRASKLAGLETIPCMVKEYSGNDIMEVQIIENLQRQDVEPTEEADAIAYLSEKYEPSEIARRLGRTDHFIRQRLKLAGLIEGFKHFVRSGEMSLKQAVKVGLFEPQEQALMLESIGEDFNVYLIDRLIQEQSFDLDRAPFDVENKTLIENVGACVTCPFNAANQGHLFGEGKMICTKAICYETKKRKVFTNLIEQAKQENILLIPEIRKYWVSDQNNQLIISELEKSGIKVYLLDDLEVVEKPEEPTLELLKEKYRHYDYTDEELQKDLDEALKEYQEEHQKYNSAIDNGFVKGIVFHPETYRFKDCYAKIKDVEASDSSSHTIPVSERRMADCTPEEQIIKIKEREQRKQHIENNKLFGQAISEIREAGYIDLDKALSKDEMIAITISLFENNVSYIQQQKYHLEFFGNTSKMSKEEIYKDFRTHFKKEMFNKLIRYLLIKQVHFGESNHTNNLTNIAFYQAMKGFYKAEMESTEQEFEKETLARAARIQERIVKLEQKAQAE
ncbi:ParB/RepB/Spo0J family partition protein [Aestuariibaculum sediminum]|uniref:ParB/RepB/Spo0J family partition protein n=1 Tax=Aestuariibaculum sediminum TaxID=2770637 RepID=A0A8J6Q981_9FLAO|nr:ParB/RepB/Spo0J family partition protein [Aestuariibaculum sediminum]MBD0833733.1 ParB/RepB/Spo0J family partition protein [Aestuariibaculum sediminum]